MRAARELTAFALLPVVLAAIVFLPPWVYLAMVWVIALFSAWELLALFRRLGQPVPQAPTLVTLGALLPGVWLGGVPRLGGVLALALLVLPVAYLLGRYPIQGAAAGIAGATFAALYFLVTAGAMGFLRTAFAGTMGLKVVLLHCITIWAGDSGAYYLGSRFGRHRLAPTVSPKKSWEGIVGGTLLTAFGVWFCRTVFFPELPPELAVGTAVLLAVLAPLGDLVESLFKRDAGVKDSSDLLPGHGGFLDRSDSLFFAAPFVLALFLLCGFRA
ncbi:MAG TPA: phosphatidate cytidylyltransferase [Thermoanaerobaculaceae bacterium]|nr:phosphatidate cytidylyltransferase [Thermoanaerobaculaceae bacterium]